MRSFSFLPSRLILVPSAPSHIPFYLFISFNISSHLCVFSPLVLDPRGKCREFPAKTVHFPPWLAGAPAPQASLAAPAISTPGESAGNSCENGSLSPAAGWGAGSTGLSRRTWHFHPRGKCRVFRRKRFTFPRGRQGHRLHSPLWRHPPFPPPGKVPGFSAKTVHFPPRPTWAPAPQASLAALAIPTSGESAGNSCDFGSLSPGAVHFPRGGVFWRGPAGHALGSA